MVSWQQVHTTPSQYNTSGVLVSWQQVHTTPSQYNTSGVLVSWQQVHTTPSQYNTSGVLVSWQQGSYNTLKIQYIIAILINIKMWFVITAVTECVLSTLKHILGNVAHEWHDLSYCITCNTIFAMVHYVAIWRVSSFPSHHYRVRNVTVQYWQIKNYKIVYKQFPFLTREWTETWGLHMLVMCHKGKGSLEWMLQASQPWRWQKESLPTETSTQWEWVFIIYCQLS